MWPGSHICLRNEVHWEADVILGDHGISWAGLGMELFLYPEIGAEMRTCKNLG